jgi:hypothetical protein
MAGTAILILAIIYASTADISDALALVVSLVATNFSSGWNAIPPIVIAIINAEKTHPVGTPPGGFNDKRVGTHMKTN